MVLTFICIRYLCILNASGRINALSLVGGAENNKSPERKQPPAVVYMNGIAGCVALFHHSSGQWRAVPHLIVGRADGPDGNPVQNAAEQHLIVLP